MRGAAVQVLPDLFFIALWYHHVACTEMFSEEELICTLFLFKKEKKITKREMDT
jgi:hypothetical protein